jgi:hypothetical protein
MPINRATRQLVRQRSNFLCEYCHSGEAGSTAVFTFDHILPQSLGGNDDAENLALACIRCNGRRYKNVDSRWLAPSQERPTLIISFVNPGEPPAATGCRSAVQFGDRPPRRS